MTSKNFIHKLLADYYLPPFSSYPPCPPFFFLPSKFLSFSLSPLPFSPFHPSLFLFQLIPTLSFISLPPLIPTLDIPFHLFHLYAPSFSSPSSPLYRPFPLPCPPSPLPFLSFSHQPFFPLSFPSIPLPYLVPIPSSLPCVLQCCGSLWALYVQVRVCVSLH